MNSTPTISPAVSNLAPNTAQDGPQSKRQPPQHQRAQSFDHGKSSDNPLVSINRQQSLREAQQQSPIRPGRLSHPTTAMQTPVEEIPDPFGSWISSGNLGEFDNTSNNADASVTLSHGLGPETLDFPQFLQIDSSAAAIAGNSHLNANGLDFEATAEIQLAPATPNKSAVQGYMLTPAATPVTREKTGVIELGKPTLLSPTKRKSVDHSPCRVAKKSSPRKAASTAKAAATKRKTAASPHQNADTLDASHLAQPSSQNLGPIDGSFSVTDPFLEDNAYASSYYSPQANFFSTPHLSFDASPEMQSFDDVFSTPSNDMTAFEACLRSYTESSGSSSDGTSPPAGASPSNTFSNGDSALNASIVETGVTDADIATFIEAVEGKESEWRCIYPECTKRFTRKENVRSHVQTHLGDRQYRCNDCQKCFVRQHDLKRHATIHSGVKPFPCKCGSSFARQDALTRHRQRGTCIGAFEGIVKKVVKRGRPRKHRPEMDERHEKADRTRKHAANKSTSSSSSGVSDFTLFSSPNPGADTEPSADLAFLTDSFTAGSLGLAQDALLYTPPTSPRSTVGRCAAPFGSLDSQLQDTLASNGPNSVESRPMGTTGLAVQTANLASLGAVGSELPVVLEEIEEGEAQADTKPLTSDKELVWTKEAMASSELVVPIEAGFTDSEASEPEEKECGMVGPEKSPSDKERAQAEADKAERNSRDQAPARSSGSPQAGSAESSPPVNLTLDSASIAQTTGKADVDDAKTPEYADEWLIEGSTELLSPSQWCDFTFGGSSSCDYLNARDDPTLQILEDCSRRIRELADAPIRPDNSLPSYGFNF